MILKKGLWLESNHGVKWKIIDMNDGKITIREYCEGANIGTITGITLKDNLNGMRLFYNYIRPTRV